MPAPGNVDDAGAVGRGNDEIIDDRHLGNGFIEAVQLLQAADLSLQSAVAIWVPAARAAATGMANDQLVASACAIDKHVVRAAGDARIDHRREHGWFCA